MKYREPFRPFAPVVLADKAADYFTLGQPAPYMSIVSRVTPLARQQIPAVVHVNGTARAQILTPEANRFLAETLTAFAEITGVPVLINTSLNIKGKPICGTPVPPLRLPRLLDAATRHLELETISGHHAVPADLVLLAGHLGGVHATAFMSQLHRARLDRPYATRCDHAIPDFVTPRLSAVRDRLRGCRVPEPLLDADAVVRLLHTAASGPAAFYKDTNPRNVLITSAGPGMVDTDDVTLAPFGYDFAKLVVTLAMTHGPLRQDDVERALDAYNTAVCQHSPDLGGVSWTELMAWAELHHIFTSPYLGRSGYRHSWHTARFHR